MYSCFIFKIWTKSLINWLLTSCPLLWFLLKSPLFKLCNHVMIHSWSGVFWWRIFTDFIDNVFNLFEHFSGSNRNMILQFSRTNLVNLVALLNWTFADAAGWRRALAISVVSARIVKISIVFSGFFTNKVNCLNFNWIDLPAFIIVLTIDNRSIKRIFYSKWRLSSR